jgi:hypothetical protein
MAQQCERDAGNGSVGTHTLDEFDRGAELRLAVHQAGSQYTADCCLALSCSRAGSPIENPGTRISLSQLRERGDTERVHRRHVLNCH